MIVPTLLLSLFILNPISHHHKKVNPRIAEMQSKAALFEEEVILSLPNVLKDHPSIPQVYFDALINDVVKLGKEKVTDPTFEADWNQLGADIDSMSWAIQMSDLPVA